MVILGKGCGSGRLLNYYVLYSVAYYVSAVLIFYIYDPAQLVAVEWFYIAEISKGGINKFLLQILGLTQYARLSASCPSLISEVGSDPDLTLSLNSSPTHVVPLGNFSATGFAEILHGKGTHYVCIFAIKIIGCSNFDAVISSATSY
jgi:hypothetical protein